MKKVLFHGSTQINWLNQIMEYSDVYHNDDLKVYLSNFKVDQFYDTLPNYKKEKLSSSGLDLKSIKQEQSKKIRLWFKLPFGKILAYAIAAFANSGFSFKVTSTYTKNLLFNYFVASWLIENQFNSVQIHSFNNPSRGLLAIFLPSNIHISIVYYGGDLMRAANSALEHYFMKIIIKRINAVTLHSYEMKEIFLSRYGREYYDKVRMQFIPPKVDILVEIDKIKNNKSDFINQLNISKDKTIVVVGNSGNPANRHLQIIEQLAFLSAEVKNNIHLILPVTYRLSVSYEKELNESLIKAKIENTLIKRMLTDNEVAKIRVIADVFIHLPISDANSGVLLEHLHAGTKCIVGKWLPYNHYRLNSVKMWEIGEFNELTNLLPEVLNAGRTDSNKDILSLIYSENDMQKAWSALIHNVGI